MPEHIRPIEGVPRVENAQQAVDLINAYAGEVAPMGANDQEISKLFRLRDRLLRPKDFSDEPILGVNEAVRLAHEIRHGKIADH